VLHTKVAAAFQNMQKAGDIALHIHMRIGGGIAHTGLCRQVDDALGLMRGKHGFHAGAVGQIGAFMHIIGVCQKARQTRLFQADIVVIVKIIQPHHGIATRQQFFGGVHANKAGSAGNQNFHYNLPSTASRGSTYFTSNSTESGLPNARMPSAPSAWNCRWPTAMMMAS